LNTPNAQSQHNEKKCHPHSRVELYRLMATRVIRGPARHVMRDQLCVDMHVLTAGPGAAQESPPPRKSPPLFARNPIVFFGPTSRLKAMVVIALCVRYLQHLFPMA